MSRIGKRPINLKENVSVSVNDLLVTVKGPKGELKMTINKNIYLKYNENIAKLSIIDSNDKEGKKKLGLYRALLKNMIDGVSDGYKTNLILSGIGYRVQKKGNNLRFLIGYSHPVDFEAPEGISFDLDGQTKIEIKGIDKELVARTSARIMKLRKRNIYKGKGIYLSDETIIKKQGKSVKK